MNLSGANDGHVWQGILDHRSAPGDCRDLGGHQVGHRGFLDDLVGPITACIGTPVVLEIGVLIAWRRPAKASDEPWRYVVTDSTVGLHTPSSDVMTRWDSISGARTRRHVWLLRLANRAFVPIPRAAFTADDAVQIDALAAAVGARTR